MLTYSLFLEESDGPALTAGFLFVRRGLICGVDGENSSTISPSGNSHLAPRRE